MKLQEIFEGRTSDALVLDKEYERLYGPQPTPSSLKPTPKQNNYIVRIAGRDWKGFETYDKALQAANGAKLTRPRSKIDIVPIKK